MYENPINQVVDKILSEVKEQEDAQLMCEIRQTIGYDIDKAELVRALRYDRQQYEKGYTDGLNANRWIPVSERLPEDSGKYIVSALDGTDRRTTAALYQPRCKAWTMTGRIAYWRVIAWMPFPKPYKAESEDEVG